jgi:hypothetical protein
VRYWILACIVLALGALVVGQCGFGDWDLDWDGDDGGGCPVCDGVVCEDDGNECTEDGCNCDTGKCGITDPLDGMVCELDGSTGVCLDGVCQEDVWCNGTCDDGNECTVNACRLWEGVCDELTPVEARVEDGTVCSGGACADGVCKTFRDQCKVDDLAAIEAGDEPDTRLIMKCWQDQLGLIDGQGCLSTTTRCLQESGTLLSAECSECFALELCCMLSECGCESPEPRCDPCVEESCQPLVDACIGGQ